MGDGLGAGSVPESPNSNVGEEILLPLANISRIMKKALPLNAKISNEAKQFVRECTSEFIFLVTSESVSFLYYYYNYHYLFFIFWRCYSSIGVYYYVGQVKFVRKVRGRLPTPKI